MLEPIAEYKWPTDCFPLASLNVRVDELARRLGLPVFSWNVDGLGPACGTGFRLASGRVFLLEELHDSIRHQKSKGPNVYVDAGDMAKYGVEKLLDEVLEGLRLTRADVDWQNEPTAQMNAAKIVQEIRAAKARHRPGAEQ